MLAIYKKELRSYFTTPLGYIFAAVFIAVSGVVFGMFTVQSRTSDVSTYCRMMILGYLVLLPLLTMRSFSEERRLRTDQLIMTSPVSVTGVVMAKFLSALTVFAGCTLLTCLFFVPLSKYGNTNVPRAFGCLVAMLLVGTCFIAVGIFISTLTESQVAAAVGTMATLLVFIMISFFNGRINSYPVRKVLSWLSVYSRFTNFTYGIFDFAALLYYISVAAVFLFLAVRFVEKRRWA